MTRVYPHSRHPSLLHSENRDENGEVDGMNLEVDSKDEVMHI